MSIILAIIALKAIGALTWNWWLVFLMCGSIGFVAIANKLRYYE